MTGAYLAGLATVAFRCVAPRIVVHHQSVEVPWHGPARVETLPLVHGRPRNPWEVQAQWRRKNRQSSLDSLLSQGARAALRAEHLSSVIVAASQAPAVQKVGPVLLEALVAVEEAPLKFNSLIHMK